MPKVSSNIVIFICIVVMFICSGVFVALYITRGLPQLAFAAIVTFGFGIVDCVFFLTNYLDDLIAELEEISDELKKLNKELENPCDTAKKD